MKLKAIHAKNLQDWSELKQLPNEVNSEIRPDRKEILLQAIIY